MRDLWAASAEESPPPEIPPPRPPLPPLPSTIVIGEIIRKPTTSRVRTNDRGDDNNLNIVSIPEKV